MAGPAPNEPSVEKKAPPPRYSPLVLVAVAMAGGICADRVMAVPGVVWWTASLALLAAWVGCSRAQLERAGSLVLLGSILAISAGWHHARWSTFGHDDVGNWATEDRQAVCLRGTLLDHPRVVQVGGNDPFSVLPGYERTVARLEVESIRQGAVWKPATGRARLRIIGPLREGQPGDRVLVFGQLSKPHTRRNPGQFDYRGLLRSRRIRAVIGAEHPECVRVERRSGGLQPKMVLARMRARAERVLWDSLARERAGLAAALLLGSREQLDDDAEEAFVKTGTMHLLAISGLHLGILAAFVWFWLNLFGVPRQRAAVTVMLLVVGYALLIESRPPVLRAAILVTVACSAIALDRPVRTANTLAAALIVVLFLNPAELFHTGLQLSFLSAGALLWFGPQLLQRAGARDPLERLLYTERSLARRAVSYVLTLLLVGVLITGLIWCVTLPLTMARFHLFSPVAFVLNVVLIPLVGLVLFCGFGTLISGLVFPLALSPFAWVCSQGIGLIEWLVEGAAALTWGHLYVPGPPAWWLAGFYGGFAAVVLVPARRKATTWCLTAAGLWIGTGFAVSLFRPAEDRVECVLLDVGHGLASVLHLPDGRTLLYDAGLLGNPRYGGQTIADYLWSRGVRRIDAIVLSHADVDHFNAAPYLAERFAVGTVFVAPSFVDFDQPAVRALFEQLAHCQIPIRFCWKGDRILPGAETEIRVLHPPAQGTGAGDNADSLVLLVRHHDRQLLLTGDLEEPGITRLIRSGTRPIEVLLSPHHGSPDANPPRLFQWAKPSIVVVSQRRHRARSLGLEAYRQSGMQAFSTAEGGAIGVFLDADGVGARYLMQASEGGTNTPAPLR